MNFMLSTPIILLAWVFFFPLGLILSVIRAIIALQTNQKICSSFLLLFTPVFALFLVFIYFLGTAIVNFDDSDYLDNTIIEEVSNDITISISLSKEEIDEMKELSETEFLSRLSSAEIEDYNLMMYLLDEVISDYFEMNRNSKEGILNITKVCNNYYNDIFKYHMQKKIEDAYLSECDKLINQDFFATDYTQNIKYLIDYHDFYANSFNNTYLSSSYQNATQVIFEIYMYEMYLSNVSSMITYPEDTKQVTFYVSNKLSGSGSKDYYEATLAGVTGYFVSELNSYFNMLGLTGQIEETLILDFSNVSKPQYAGNYSVYVYENGTTKIEDSLGFVKDTKVYKVVDDYEIEKNAQLMEEKDKVELYSSNIIKLADEYKKLLDEYESNEDTIIRWIDYDIYEIYESNGINILSFG